MDEAQCIEKLMLFGLTRQEAVIYLCLFHSGEITGYEAAKQTGISRSNVYNALAGLVEHGAAYMSGGSANRYKAVPLEEFCDNYMRHLKQAAEFLQNNVQAPAPSGEGYITIEGARHIWDKILHMLSSAAKRIYISAPGDVLERLSGPLQELLCREIKVVLLSDCLPQTLPVQTKEADGVIFFRLGSEEAEARQNQIRLIIDSAYVLTGDIGGKSGDTCLYSDQKNFVNVFKEAMHNEIKLIELRS